MAKALYGFVGGPDSRREAELTMLRARVRELEAEVNELRRSQPLPLDDSLDLALLTSPDAALV